MKRNILLLSILCTIGLASATQPKGNKTQSINDIAWIVGQWQRTNVRPGTTAYEFWEKSSEKLLSGIGFSMKGADTTFIEKLKIELKDGTLYYVADVRENAEPVYFKLTEITDHGFVSENPEHDFPKMISYELKDAVMTAVISDGGEKKMGFVFKRKD
ncbi:MAG: hypothetical protein HWE07_13290 [Cytophagia bacterium]|nr:hypothetical protein [Cytophagia bacterium]